MSSMRATMSKRARTVAGATAISLGGFAVAGFGAWRPAAAYGAGLSPRTFALSCDVEVSDDTGLQGAVAGSVDDSVICITQSIILSDSLSLEDTSITLVGDDSSVTLTAPPNKRHIETFLRFDDAGALTVSDLTLQGGRTSDDGGSILALRVDVTVERSRFTDNYADNGGAIYALGGSVTTTATDFTDNAATSGGAIYSVTGDVRVTGGTFHSNEADETGGAIYAGYSGANVTLTNVVFTDNDANGGAGGAVFAGGGTVATNGGEFEYNTANTFGGAIYTSLYLVDITDTDFSNNLAGASGGAVHAGSDGVIAVESSFTLNTADDSGGAIFSPSGTITVSDTNFTDDSTATGSGGAIYTGREVFTDGGTFHSAYAGNSGGAIFSMGGVQTTDTTFTLNTASAAGGAIHSGRDVDTTLGHFNDNVAGAAGGALYAQSGEVTTDGTDFTDNEAAASGGAIWGYAIYVNEGTFSGNTADDSGGALYAGDGLITIRASDFSSNEAGLDGGAVFGGQIDLDDSVTFTGNSAPGGQGGAIYANGDVYAYVYACDTEFTGNWSGWDGGAIRADAYVKAKDSIFTDNYTGPLGNGGAISAQEFYGSVVSMLDNGDDSLGYPVTAEGGAIWSDDTVTLFGSYAAGNRAATHGGAIFTGGDVTTSGGVLINNTADFDGGAIYAAGTVTTTNTYFTGNTAENRYGGAIRSLSAVTTYGGSFTDNTVARQGGAIHASGAVSTTNTDFTGNVTNTYWGGAIRSDTTVTANGGSFTSNNADAGGAIFADDAVAVTDSAFIGNSAEFDGGAIFSLASVSAVNTTFYANLAVRDGAALFADELDLAFVTSVDDSAAAGAVFRAVVPPPPGTLKLVGSVISPAVGGGTTCSTPADDSSYDSFVTDGSCGSGDDTVTITTRALLGFDDTLVTDDSTVVLIPDDTSILVNAAPADLVLGVTRDQLRATRGRPPGEGSTTVGAVQVLPVLFTTQPANSSVTAGGTATFTVAADPGVGTSPVTFQWQTSSDGGATWANAAGPGISGATTGTLTLASASAPQNGLLVRAVASDLRPTAANSATATLTVTTPSPGPGPVPATPPGAPHDPLATAGDASASVTWIAPASIGSFAITTYQVTNDLDDNTCLLTVGPDTPLACEVTGLTNGTAYRFRVRALTGAGWGPWSDWSDAVTPTAPPDPPGPPSILVTGMRDGTRVRVTGTAANLTADQVRTRVRLQGQKGYRDGVTRPVSSSGNFTWQRTTSKKVYVYFTADGIRSNRIIIPSRR